MTKQLTKEEIKEKIREAKDKIGKSNNIKKADEQIPQLSWILLLKLIDDYEKRKEDQEGYKPIIPAPFRWRDWTSDKKITGEKFHTFVTVELFPKLRDLPVEKDLEYRSLITSIFRSIDNRIQNGYVLKEIINSFEEIKFTNTKTVKDFLEIYEDELREMKNAAANRAEFYTPNAIVHFIVNQIKPDFRKKEKIFDPACGLSGFLLESFKYMKKFEKTSSDIDTLRYNTLYGVEKEGKYFLCAVLRMLLYDIDKPNLLKDDSLLKETKNILPKDQYQVIMTNPTYGGPQSSSRKNFLHQKLKGATPQAHFLYYVMQSLHENGRAAVIMSNGLLSDTKKAATEIKKELLEKFNLHTIIRLPATIFEPYNSIETNILFFDTKGPTNQIWYYKMEIPERVAPSYGKTKEPIIEDFEDVSKWMNHKQENNHAWLEKIEKTSSFNLDIKHPNKKEEKDELSPHELIFQIISDEKKTLELLEDVEKLIQKEIPK